MKKMQLALVAITGWLCAPVSAQTLDVSMAPFTWLAKDGVNIGCTNLARGYVLTAPSPFGGLSAMAIREDTIFLLADTGRIFSGKITRDELGFVSSIAALSEEPLQNKGGVDLGKRFGDSEGLLLEENGDALVSIEGNHRIMRFRHAEGSWLADERLFSKRISEVGPNRGLESLTRLQDGRLLSMTEFVSDEGFARLFINEAPNATTWHEHRYRPAPDFAVTEAATDPLSGDVFVLERAFSRARGPRARLVRIDASAMESLGASPMTIEGTELARFSLLHGIDNMEGLIVERDQAGTLFAHLLSDDNFNDIQRTVLMGLQIDEGEACLPAPKAGPGPNASPG